MDQLAQRQVGAVKVARIGPGAHCCSLFALAALQGSALQGLHHIATGKDQMGGFALAVHGHFQAGGERIGHAHAHAVQAAGEAVRAAAAFVELAARVQAGEDQLDHGGVFFGVQAKGDAAPVVLDADRAIVVQGDADFFAKSGQGFVGGVVDHLLHDVQRVVGAGVHARALLDGLKPFEHADGAFGISGRRRQSGGGISHSGANCSGRTAVARKDCMKKQFQTRCEACHFTFR